MSVFWQGGYKTHQEFTWAISSMLQCYYKTQLYYTNMHLLIVFIVVQKWIVYHYHLHVIIPTCKTPLGIYKSSCMREHPSVCWMHVLLYSLILAVSQTSSPWYIVIILHMLYLYIIIMYFYVHSFSSFSFIYYTYTIIHMCNI